MLIARIIKSVITIGCLISAAAANSQQAMDLWPDDASMPYFKASDIKEYEADCGGYWCVYNVTKPTLTIYPANNGDNRFHVVIMPGGGYEVEAIKHEGYEVAVALAARGITAGILKYRIPNPKSSTQPEMTPLADARRAIQMMRDAAIARGEKEPVVGVMGFSAGSHLATVASVWQGDDAAAQPDFSALIYGVTNLNVENKKWLEDTLYHRAMTDAEIRDQTLLERVSDKTPPAFLVHAMDDTVCHYTESTLYAEALTKAGVEMEMHLFPTGGHGFGLGRDTGGTRQWIDLAATWTKNQ